MDALAELNGIIQHAYTRENEIVASQEQPEQGAESHYQSKTIYDLTEKDCNSTEEENQQTGKKERPVTQLRILEAWKLLVNTLMEKEVFLDYYKILKQGLEASTGLETANVQVDESGTRMAGGAAIVGRDNLCHVETLVSLLVQTADNVQRDDSTECRFVTLLEVLLSYTPGWEASEELARLWIRLMQRVPYQCAPSSFRRKAYRVLVSLSWVPSSRGLLAACSIPKRSVRMRPLPKASRSYRSSTSNNNNSSSIDNTNDNNGEKSQQPLDNPVIIPRHDTVNQVLDRLKDETDVSIAITSSQPGIGKSTLASLVVSHPSIRKSFLLVWLRLKSEENSSNEAVGKNNASSSHSMSYEAYREYITQILEQVQEQNGHDADEDENNEGHGSISTKKFTFPTCERRFEEPALRRLREEKAMEETKERVAQKLRALRNPNLLLVLDNVTSDAQIPVFRFHDKQSMIVNTTLQDLDNVDWNVNLDPLSLDEAVDLFLGHAGLRSSHPLGRTSEVKSLLELDCQSLPLTIRTVGRWCRLKSVAVGPIRACIEVLKEIEALSMEQHHNSCSSLTFAASGVGSKDGASVDGQQSATTKRFLFDILSLMMGPSQTEDENGKPGPTSAVFVVFLAAMVVVFSGRVPLDVVLLLWEQMLGVEPFAYNEVTVLLGRRRQTRGGSNGHYDSTGKERRQFVGLIAQGLLHMGVIEIYEVDGERWIDIHHDMYAQFALAMANGLDFGETSFEVTARKWHKAFVTSYFEQRIQANIAINVVGGKNSLDYAVRSLPTHIFQANMIKMAETMLVDPMFFETRVDTLGWDRAVDIHIKDCLQLQSGFLEYHANNDRRSTLNSVSSMTTSSSSEALSSDLLMVCPVFSKTSAMIASFDVGATRMNDENDENNSHNFNSESEDEKQRSASSADVSRALYRMAFALAGHGYYEAALAQLTAAQKIAPDLLDLQASILYGMSWALLVSGDSKQALRKINSALKLMKELDNHHLLYKDARLLHIDALYERCEYKKALSYLDEIEAELSIEKERNMIELGAVVRKRGCLLQAMGKPKEAADAFVRAIEWKEKANECSYGLASCYCQLGDVNMELHLSSGIRENFERAVSTLVDARCDREHVSYLVATGKLFFLKSDYTRGFATLESAQRAIAVAPLYLMDQSAYDLRCIGRVYRGRGKLDEAVRVLREALVLTAHKPQSLERASCLLDLGISLLEGSKDDDEGLWCLQEALAIMMVDLGHCMQVLDLLNTIGVVHKMRGEYDESLTLYGRAAIVLGTVAPDDTEIEAQLFFAVGDVEETRGNMNRAHSAYEKVIEVLEQTHASDDPFIAKANLCMGRVLAATNRLEEAREKLEEAVRISSHHYDERSLAESKAELGVVLRKLGSVDQSC